MCTLVFLLLLTVAFVTSRGTTQTPPSSFTVATIKPSKAAGLRLQPTADGYTAKGVTLRMLLQEAYGVYDDKLLIGGPPWLNSDKFDLEAKFDINENGNEKRLTYRQRADMLRSLLAERFNVSLHHELKSFSVYNLVLARGGSKLLPTKSESNDPSGIEITCYVLKNRPGYTQRRDCTVASLLDLLLHATGRTVLDKTNLVGRYDFELRWTPDNFPSTAEDVYSGPSIFVAVQEQLGLKLEPSSAPLDVLVVDHAERPSDN